jgi:hypothetical protein
MINGVVLKKGGKEGRGLCAAGLGGEDLVISQFT